MAQPLQIDLVLTGLNTVSGGLNSVATVLNSVGKAQRAGSAATQSQAQQIRVALNLQKANLGVQSAQVRLQQQQIRLQQQMNRASGGGSGGRGGAGGGGSFGQNLQRAIYSSRVGMNPNGGVSLMPLVGSLATLLGPEFAIVALGAAAAMKTLSAAAEHAATTIMAFRGAYFTGGGTQSQTAQLAGIGAALGMSPGAVAGSARAFKDEISSNGIAMGAANRMGIHDYGVFDTTNATQKLIKAIDALRGMTEQEAIRTAREIPSLEPFLQTRDLDEKTWKELKRQFEGLATPEASANAMKLNLEMAKLNVEMAKLGAKVLPWVTEGIKFINSILSPNPNGKPGAGFINSTPGFPGSDKFKSKDPLRVDPLKDAVDKNTAAVEGNTQAMNGIYGGGSGVRGAIPSGWASGIQWNHLRGQAYNLGAFSV